MDTPGGFIRKQVEVRGWGPAQVEARTQAGLLRGSFPALAKALPNLDLWTTRDPSGSLGKRGASAQPIPAGEHGGGLPGVCRCPAASCIRGAVFT